MSYIGRKPPGAARIIAKYLSLGFPSPTAAELVSVVAGVTGEYLHVEITGGLTWLYLGPCRLTRR